MEEIVQITHISTPLQIISHRISNVSKCANSKDLMSFQGVDKGPKDKGEQHHKKIKHPIKNNNKKAELFRKQMRIQSELRQWESSERKRKLPFGIGQQRKQLQQSMIRFSQNGCHQMRADTECGNLNFHKSLTKRQEKDIRQSRTCMFHSSRPEGYKKREHRIKQNRKSMDKMFRRYERIRACPISNLESVVDMMANVLLGRVEKRNIWNKQSYKMKIS